MLINHLPHCIVTFFILKVLQKPKKCTVINVTIPCEASCIINQLGTIDGMYIRVIDKEEIGKLIITPIIVQNSVVSGLLFVEDDEAVLEDIFDFQFKIRIRQHPI